MKFLKFLNEDMKFEAYFKINNKWSKRYETSAPTEGRALSNFMKKLSDDYKISVEVISKKFSQKDKKWFPIGGYDYIMRKIK